MVAAHFGLSLEASSALARSWQRTTPTMWLHAYNRVFFEGTVFGFNVSRLPTLGGWNAKRDVLHHCICLVIDPVRMQYAEVSQLVCLALLGGSVYTLWHVYYMLRSSISAAPNRKACLNGFALPQFTL